MSWNNINDIFPESHYVKDYENLKWVNMPPCWAAQLPLILDMISNNTDLQGGHKVFCRSELYTQDHKNRNWELEDCP